MEIKLVINGRPVGKGRPRFTRTGHAYTPQKTRDYEATVRAIAKRETLLKPKFLDGVWGLSIVAFYKIPSSWSKAKTRSALLGEIRPTVKPDSDNIEKIIADSLNGIIYNDDKQIVSTRLEKFYAIEPRVEVTLTLLDEKNG